MINTLLAKIAGFFDKDFLFSSFLPVLIFSTFVALPLAGILGFDAVWMWAEGWSASQKGVASAAAGLGIVVFAYVLHGLRSAFARFWSGNVNSLVLHMPMQMGTWFQNRKYFRLCERCDRVSPWKEVFEEFRENAESLYGPSRPAVPDEVRRRLKRSIGKLRLNTVIDDEAIKSVRVVLREFLTEYKLYDPETLGDAYKDIKMTLELWDEKTKTEIQTLSTFRDRRFGTPATIKPTALGNVIEAYNQYSFKRYKIEGEVFWPRLRSVMKPEYLSLVEDQQALLYFFLTNATLALIYAFAALMVGPWLWFKPWLWLLLAIAAAGCSHLFYRLSVVAAEHLGDLVRSSFDLYRLDLMKALGRNVPPTFQVERAQWDEISKMVVFGETHMNFPVCPPPK